MIYQAAKTPMVFSLTVYTIVIHVAMGSKLFGVPERFQIEVAEANAILDQER